MIAEGSAAELKSRLGRTVVEVGVPPDSIDRAKRVLATIGPTEMLDGGRGAGVVVDDGPRGAVAVLRAMDAAGVPPETIVVREPTLDDVFLQLTGRRAVEHTDDEAA